MRKLKREKLLCMLEGYCTCEIVTQNTRHQGHHSTARLRSTSSKGSPDKVSGLQTIQSDPSRKAFRLVKLSAISIRIFASTLYLAITDGVREECHNSHETRMYLEDRWQSQHSSLMTCCFNKLVTLHASTGTRFWSVGFERSARADVCSSQAVLPGLPINFCPFKFTAIRSFMVFGRFFMWFLSLGV